MVVFPPPKKDKKRSFVVPNPCDFLQNTKAKIRQNVNAALSLITKATWKICKILVFHRRQRDWDDLRVSKWWEKIHFGWSIPLRTQTRDLEKHKAFSFVIKIKEDICCERDTRKHYKSAGLLAFSHSLFFCQKHVQAIFQRLALCFDRVWLILDSESVLFSCRRSWFCLQRALSMHAGVWAEVQSVLKTFHS